MLFNQILRSISRATGRQVANIFGGWATEAANSELAVSLTYGVTVAVNASRGNVQSLAVTDGVAYTISSPTNPPATGYGQLLMLIIVNAGVVASGLGAFGAGYTDTGDVPVLQPGERVAVTFQWNGTTWLEVGRSSSAAADALQIRRQVTELTDAQVKALPTTGLLAISPAPAAGKVFYPLSCVIVCDNRAGAYGNVIEGSYLCLTDATGTEFLSGYVAQNAAESAPNLGYLLGAEGGARLASVAVPIPTAFVLADDFVYTAAQNDADLATGGVHLFVDQASDFTGGNVANFMRIILLYMEIDVAP